MSQCFSCTCCGECCTGAQVVRLNPDDLELLRDYLGLPSIQALLDSHWVRPASPPDPRPVLRFRSRPLVQCPFLENHVDEAGILRGLCALHPDHKPLVCHLAPLAREVDYLTDTETWTMVPPVEGCPGMGQGPVIEAAAPEHLRARLDREQEWMRKQFQKI